LRVDPSHPAWNGLARAFAKSPSPSEPLIHWSRLAEPVPHHGVCDGQSWRLVA